MININGNPPRLIKINDTVPDIVKINGSTVWKNAFDINFKANFYWDSVSNSSGCWDWYDDILMFSGFTITANHYFPHLYLDLIKFSFGKNSDTYKISSVYELKSGQTLEIEKELETGNSPLKVDFCFRASENVQMRKIISVSFDFSHGQDEFSISGTYSGTISAFTQDEIASIAK